MTRILKKLSESKLKVFSNSINILMTWKEVNRINLEKLQRLNKPVAKIHVVYMGILKPRRLIQK